MTQTDERPTLVRRIGLALLALLMIPIGGIPVLIGVAVESGIVAWFFAEILRWGDIGTVFAWVFGIQIGLLLLYMIPVAIAMVVTVLRTGKVPK